MMRILHAPKNIAGQAGIIAQAQKSLGFQSDVLVLRTDDFRYPSDINLHFEKRNKLAKFFVWLTNFIRCFFSYDVFHFHFGESLLPYNLDLPLYKIFGKRVLMQYWGSDVFQTDRGQKYTAFSKIDFAKIYPKIDNEKKRRRLAWMAQKVHLTLVGDYSLLPFSPKSQVVRQVLDYTQLLTVRSGKNVKLKIVHAPTSRDIKGTAAIIKVVDQLAQKYPLELILVEKVPHHRALKIYAKADIIIDDIKQGPYGIFAMECMALAKPVLCRIDPAFKTKYQHLPIVDTNQTNLKNNLIRLIQNRDLRSNLGRDGRKYVQQNHDPQKIAKQLIQIYKEL